ncbi:Acetylornithine aminotransferase [Trichinella pseudospiralis]
MLFSDTESPYQPAIHSDALGGTPFAISEWLHFIEN